MATSSTTIGEILREAVAQHREQSALASIREGQLRWRTWGEVEEDVRRIVCGLKIAGVGQGDRVAQYTPNSYEWIIADLAMLSMGAVHVPLHDSLSLAEASALVNRAEVHTTIVHEPRQLSTPWVTQKHLLDSDPDDFTPPEIDADALATILFTSGTTGAPQGVMLSHRNLVTNTRATAEAVGARSNETRLVILPLSHIYARTCDLYSWLHRGTQLVLAQSRETIIRDAQLAQPTVINGVPYFYQKVAQRLRAAGKTNEPDVLRHLLGGNVIRLFCGGAAVSPELESLYAAQDLPLLSGYGLTEASPVVSATSLENYSLGTVGKPLGNLEVKLADDGEVLVQGPSVMLGYWQDEEATRKALQDGWLHTGDLGEFDADCNLKIVGRKKEIIVLSTGKNVSPTALEQRLANSPLVEHACVVGDGRKCLGVLIVPNPDTLRREIRQRKLWVWSKRRAVTHPKIRQLYRKEIDRVLKGTESVNQIGPFTILPRNFSRERGELTPKMSLCRGRITVELAGEIDAMYRQFSSQR